MRLSIYPLTKHLVAGASGLALLLTGAAPLGAAQPPVGVLDNYIVVLHPNASADVVARGHGLSPTHVYRAALNGFAGRVPAGHLPALRADPRVEEVIPDRVVRIPPAPAQGGTADEALGKLTGGSNTTGQVVPAGVSRIGAAPSFDALSPVPAYTGAGVGVAIVDTGIDFNHPDLAVAPTCFTAYTACQDDHGHGTHVAGIVAARNNTQDVVGVAPDTTLYAVKVLDQSGSGSDSAIIAGLDWIKANATKVSPPIRVVNMSLGRDGSLDDDPALRAAVKALHDGDPLNSVPSIAVVVAAGNDATKEVSQQVPATYPEVFAVASTVAQDGVAGCAQVKRDTASYFTTDGTFNPTSGIGVTISAPGEQQEDISKGCLLRSIGILSTKLGGGTTRMAGTSMAAPHVAGVLARMWDKADEVPGGVLDPEEARARLRSSATVAGTAPLDSPTRSYTFDGEREGVLNAQGALN